MVRVGLLVPCLVFTGLVLHAELPRAQQPHPYSSTYKPPAAPAVVIRNATILPATGPAIETGSIVLQNGRIAAVARGVNASPDAIVIAAAGTWVTPGTIDTHSHIGVYAAP